MANPFAALGFPDARPDRFFLAELDTLWQRDEDAAKRILDAAIEMGLNHLMAGPAIAHGYHGHYPDTDWLADPGGLARYLRYVQAQGVAISFVHGTDIQPYYDDQAHTFDWARMAELGEFYRRLREDEGFVPWRGVSQWEQWQASAEAARLFDWLREAAGPDVPLAWHSPPGHLSPGSGDEEERATWDSALAHGISHLYLQAVPLDDDAFDPGSGRNSAGRTALEQAKYDLWDMQRRARGDGSPWGGPLVAGDGQPLRVVFAEGTAHPKYWQGLDQAVCDQWRAMAVAEVGECLDAL